MDSNKIKTIIDGIIDKKPKILVLGDVMLDKYIFGNVQRISPEAPVPILNYGGEEKVLGGAGNVAHNLINLGAEVYIATIIGNGLNGDKVKGLFEDIKVFTEYIIQATTINTTTKTRFISNGNQLLRLDNDSIGLDNYDINSFKKNLLTYLNTFDCIIISDYNKGVCSESLVQKIIIEAKKLGVAVFIDPKGSSWKMYTNGTCLTPNTEEVERKLGIILNTDLSFENAARFIKETYKLDSCLITRGADGMTYYDSKTVIHQKVGEREVFDVSGAGDTVLASISAGYSSGINLSELISFSSSTSSMVVSHVGTTPFSTLMLSGSE